MRDAGGLAASWGWRGDRAGIGKIPLASEGLVGTSCWNSSPSEGSWCHLSCSHVPCNVTESPVGVTQVLQGRDPVLGRELLHAECLVVMHNVLGALGDPCVPVTPAPVTVVPNPALILAAGSSSCKSQRKTSPGGSGKQLTPPRWNLADYGVC